MQQQINEKSNRPLIEQQAQVSSAKEVKLQLSKRKGLGIFSSPRPSSNATSELTVNQKSKQKGKILFPYIFSSKILPTRLLFSYRWQYLP